VFIRKQVFRGSLIFAGEDVTHGVLIRKGLHSGKLPIQVLYKIIVVTDDLYHRGYRIHLEKAKLV
jgi:hypothetical protein